MFHKRLLKEFKENQKLVAGMVMTQWITLLANVVLVFALALFVSNLLQGQTQGKLLWILPVTLIAVMLVRGIANTVNQKLSFQASSNVKRRLRELTYEKLMRLGTKYHENIATSEAVQISTEGVDQLEIYFGKYVPQFFYSLLAPLTLFVIVGTMSMKVAAVLLLCVPLIPISIVAVQKFAKKMLQKYWGTYTELGDSFLENLQGLTTLKIYQADERYEKKMDEEAEKFRKVTMRVLIMQLNSISVMDIVAYGGAAIGMILSVLELRAGAISLAQCFFIIMVSAEFFLPLRMLGSFFHIAMNGMAASDKIFALLDVKKEETGEIAEEVPQTNDLCMQDLSFSYDESRQILVHINLLVKSGQFVALVGASGCGKSTIASLFMGRNTADQGQITLGGLPLAAIPEDVRMQKITYVSHDAYLFKGSVRDNLLMAKEDATEGEMWKVLEQTKLADFLRQEEGLDTKLLEKASNLSGGQRQRLALARALLHDSPIYIFDEATSNIDVESENDIMEQIIALAKTKTVLLISHRLANVVGADQIYVLEKGQIVEVGQHESLLQEQKTYASLWQAQQELENYGKSEKGGAQA